MISDNPEWFCNIARKLIQKHSQLIIYQKSLHLLLSLRLQHLDWSQHFKFFILKLKAANYLIIMRRI
jgi:hypothetical protein